MKTKPNAPLTKRRTFIKAAGALGVGLYLGGAVKGRPALAAQGKNEALALNGGPKAVTAELGNATKWPLYGEEEIQAVSELLRSPGYGPIAEFEEAWKAYHECPYVKAHCNGTSALTSMMFALELPPGSEVLVPDFSTWFPVVPMRFFELVPVFVDADPRTMNISVEDCKRRLTSKTRAIMPVHWYGLPCDMDDICAFAQEHDLQVVEDASHAHGARVKGTLVGNWGRMAGFSLQTGKPLPSIEGGIANYKDRGDYERAVTYGNYDLPRTFPEDSPYRKYQGTAFGSKLRMHPASAILARIQLKGLDERNTAGVAQIRRMNDRLMQLPGLTEQYVRPDVERVFYANNPMFIDEKKAGMSRAAAVKALQAEGVSVGEYTWTLLHSYPIFQEDKWWRHMPVLPEEGSVPGCDEINRKAIHLPYWTSDQPELIDQYVAAFEKVWAHRDELGKA
ncbi:MAG TPA: DegT/DnrJ/EryC1/StrS family aminotransferase [Candidatus Hydrogenedentes bacterium]|nr:DegT/DnrJ/EryC1/StrS family aminotransferase [Candidatus Hydrogenedentota bacterium]HQM50727.1 DegT/DnrJ/EryC1/StrS family aminotransferase [Candidatus Hydrogenedentota bacterium]